MKRYAAAESPCLDFRNNTPLAMGITTAPYKRLQLYGTSSQFHPSSADLYRWGFVHDSG